MEKVGKRVFKMKPSKSGINKLPLFCQFRPACKKLGSSDETFCRTWKFSAKWYMYIFYSTSAREGPLPLPNCFFCYTRPSSRSGLRPTRPPWLILLPRKESFSFHLYPISGQLTLQKTLLETFAFRLPPTGAMAKPIFSSHWTSPNSSHKTLLWFYLKCPAVTPTFFTSLMFPQQDHMSFPLRYCLNFEKKLIWFLLPFFTK